MFPAGERIDRVVEHQQAPARPAAQPHGSAHGCNQRAAAPRRSAAASAGSARADQLQVDRERRLEREDHGDRASLHHDVAGQVFMPAAWVSFRLRCSRRRLRMHCVFEGIGGRGRVAGLVAVACVRAWVRERAPNTFGVRRWSALVHAWGVGAPEWAARSDLFGTRSLRAHGGSTPRLVQVEPGSMLHEMRDVSTSRPVGGPRVSILHVRPAVLNDGARRSLFGCGSRALRRPPLPRQTSTTRAARSRRPRRRRSRRRAAPPPTAAARRRPRAPRRSGT